MSNLSDSNITTTQSSPSWLSQLGSGVAQAGLSALTGGVGGIASGILGGLGSSLFGSIFGGKSDVEKQNEMNYRIWQEQMAHNEHMYNKQFSDNVKLWQMENAYNDPSAVRKRWEDAGFNPYLMMNGSGVGTAGSVNSPAMQNSTPPTMQAELNSAYDGMSMIQSSLPMLGTIEKITNDKIDGDLKRLDLIGKSLENDFNRRMYPWLYEQQQQLVKDMWQAFDFREESNDLQLQQMRADIRKSQLSIEEQEIINTFLPGLKYAEFLSACQNFANLVRDGELKLEQARNLVVARANTIADIKLKEQDYNLRKPAELQANAVSDVMQDPNLQQPLIGPPQHSGKQLLRDIAINQLYSDLYNSQTSKKQSSLRRDKQDIINGSYEWMPTWLRYTDMYGQDLISGLKTGAEIVGKIK